jgi:hypothetical protein
MNTFDSFEKAFQYFCEPTNYEKENNIKLVEKNFGIKTKDFVLSDFVAITTTKSLVFILQDEQSERKLVILDSFSEPIREYDALVGYLSSHRKI